MVKFYFILALSLFYGWNWAAAEDHVQLLKVKVLRTKREEVAKNKTIVYAYGDLQHRLVYRNGKVKNLEGIRNSLMGEVNDVKRMEGLGWYMVGLPSPEQKKYFSWGKARNINEKAYTPYLGIRGKAVEPDSEEDIGEEEEQDEEESLSQKSPPSNKKNAGEEEESVRNTNPASKNLQKIHQLVQNLTKKNNLQDRVIVFGQTFPSLSANNPGITDEIDMVMDELEKNERTVFFETAVEYSLRNGESSLLDYFLKRLQKLISWRDNSYYVKQYPDGSKYFGEWQNGRREGFGSLTMEDGKRYTGYWRNDQREGYGIFRWADGSRYFGLWRNDKKDGFGLLVFPDGFIYRHGFWKEDKYIGEQEQVLPKKPQKIKPKKNKKQEEEDEDEEEEDEDEDEF